MLSCETCENFKNTYFEEHLPTTASKHKSNFLEVFCRGCCSALINVVIKYSFSAAVFQSWRALYVNLLKICPPSDIFWGGIYFGNIPAWLLLKVSCKHILLWRHFKEERIFMIFFTGFREKCKHTELASHFVQKQYFS